MAFPMRCTEHAQRSVQTTARQHDPSFIAVVRQLLSVKGEREHGIEMTRRDIPLDDREAIRNCSNRDLMGIFQLEASQVKPVADAMKLDSLFDISR